MVHHNKKQHTSRGFTLVELIVVLAITAILAALVGGGLIGYIRLARFEKNEANARTLFQAAQIALTRKDTAGELDTFRTELAAKGKTGTHFSADTVTLTEAERTDDAGNVLAQDDPALQPVREEKARKLNNGVYALYYDKNDEAGSNDLVKSLLGNYITDQSLLDAAVCVEIDYASGQVYSVFYDTNSDKLRFNEDGATNIFDRSYSYRRNESLVGYYSADDTVNVVELQQTQLKVKNPRLSNGETLTLSWGGNSRLNDIDTTYVATAYAENDDTRPLFELTIEKGAAAADDDKQVPTWIRATVYDYSGAGAASKDYWLCMPLSYNKGSFVLTLDAMSDAALLRAAENNPLLEAGTDELTEPHRSMQSDANSSLYSITRLLNEPKNFSIVMEAKPRAGFEESYTTSKKEQTNVENTLLAKDADANKGDLKYFRHLYNLRWASGWNTTAATAEYTLQPQSTSSTGLNWTSGGVTVYTATNSTPAAKTPTAKDPVAWPTIPELADNIKLTSELTAGGVTRVPILNLQLRGSSVAKAGKKVDGTVYDELADRYIGLVGKNEGAIDHITLRDVDLQVNATEVTLADGEAPLGSDLTLTKTTVLRALDETDADYRDLRAVGALCGVNTGTLTDCALIRGTNTSARSRVLAALKFDDDTTVTEPETGKTGDGKYTCIKNEPRGIGGLVGVAMPETDSKMSNLTVTSNVTVAGLLLDEDSITVAKADATADVADAVKEAAEKARYAAAAADADAENALWRSIGVGGVFGTLNADGMTTNADTAIANYASVTGSAFVGGVAGNLYGTDDTSLKELTGLANSGNVSAGTNYTADTEGEHSAVLGQFFGGLAGYSRNVKLTGCTSIARTDLTENELKSQVKNSYNDDGTMKDSAPLKGDFVGGLVGFGKNVQLVGCKTERGYVLGRRFVGGVAGGLTGAEAHSGCTNGASVFGNRYVGGIVSLNGSGSTISSMTNTGLAAAFGPRAAFVGGVVGRNDAAWGTADGRAAGEATVLNCVNSMSGDNVTDANRVALLRELSTHESLTEYANYVGGIVGYNGTSGIIRWSSRTTDGTAAAPTVGAILYGDSFVGGVAGYNADTAKIENNTQTLLTVRGQIAAAGDAIGGLVGMNCAPELPAAKVSASAVTGRYYVGGVIGANLPVGSFTVTPFNMGTEQVTFQTDGTAGRVTADAVAGGIIGYNRLLAAMPADTTPRALLPTFTDVSADARQAGKLRTGAGTPANKAVTFAGFANKLSLSANAYVGGILGYNDDDTTLNITGAVNGRSGSASAGSLSERAGGTLANGVLLNNLADGRYTFPNMGDNAPTGSIAGGIIGYASTGTKLENCANYGIVNHKKAAGGFAGWNKGTIIGGTMDAPLGSRQEGYLYLGGIAGINDGTVQNAFPANGRTVGGEQAVGGVAGVNLGGAAVTVSTATGTASVSASRNAGGIAGINLGTVTAQAGAQFQMSVSATTNAGGIAGLNTTQGTQYRGTITGTATGTSEYYAIITGSVSATTNAGGAAGRNEADIAYVNNQASVRAGGQQAGGIAGENADGGIIRYGRHMASEVYATSGKAGGIAGINYEGARIDNATVSANVTAANGEAGGITAENRGDIGAENTDGGTVTGCTITGRASSIGAAAANNQQSGGIYHVTVAENAGVVFNTPATIVGGIAGHNLGKIYSCTVNSGALNLGTGLSAGGNSVMLGGAVGYNQGEVNDTTVEQNLTANLDKYTHLGGVAGQNDGTLLKCAYSGTMGGTAASDGTLTGGAVNVGSTMGGIAGLNNRTVESCRVGHITLQAQGASNISDIQTAAQKLQNASHVGGVVGRNNGTVKNSYIAADNGSLIAVRYGFVGGVAGSNSGTITGSGSAAAFETTNTATQPLMTKVAYWLAQQNENGKDLESQVKYARLNAMVDILKNGKKKDSSETAEEQARYSYDYSGLRGVDVVAANNNTTGIYTTYLDRNDLLVALRGTAGSSVDGERASGYLGGVTGFNTVTGSITNCATGKWFVYGDNISLASSMGGIIGQNESNEDLGTIVNCAAVRRFTCVKGSADNGDKNIVDTETYKSTKGLVVHVGGVIGSQQNRTDDQWNITNALNYGMVYNSRSGHVGGVLGFWSNYGGTLQRCFNFGELKTNTNYSAIETTWSYGGIGGIVGIFDKPVSGSTTNILSCQNHGNILGETADSRANDCGGIVGKFNLADKDDYMVLNIIDCVNGRVTIAARSMAAGIMGWVGPSGRINNVEINIDRCRNYSTDMPKPSSGAKCVIGIVGDRGDGSYSDKATKITNCFSLAKSDDYWRPIIRTRGIKNGRDNLTGSKNNFYMDDGKAFAQLHRYKLGSDDSKIAPVNDWGSSITYYDENKNSDKGNDILRVGGRRLLAGVDTSATDEWQYFAILPNGQNDKGNWDRDLDKIEKNTAYIKGRVVWGKTGNSTSWVDEPLATVALRLKETDGKTGFTIDDITDESIQDYYMNVLDVGAPNQPDGLKVVVGTTEHENNVYGRYELTWNAPKTDATHGPASYYLVEILQGDEVKQSAYVYNTRYTFDNLEKWEGSFTIRITPYNTADAGTPLVDSTHTFMKTLPTPDVEVRLVRDPAVTERIDDKGWKDMDGLYPWAYEQVVVLKNADAYPKDDVWKVTVTIGTGTNGDTYTFTANQLVQTRDVRRNLGKATTFTAIAEPANGTTDWMRSGKVDESIYIPSTWLSVRDNVTPSYTYDQNGLPRGTLTSKVAVTGTSVEDMEISTTLAFTPSSANQGSPVFRVMLMGQYTGDKSATLTNEDGTTYEIPLKNQFVTLAAQERTITTSPTTITFSGLPADTLSNYSNWRILALPINSGLGSFTTRWDATNEEVNELFNESGYGETAWYRAAIEIVRKADGTGYEFAHFAPLGFAMTDYTSTDWYANAANQTNQFLSDKLANNTNILQAPTLSSKTVGNVDEHNNKLTYTFTWTQNDLNVTDNAPKYDIKLYGMLSADNDDDKEEITLNTGVDLTDAAHLTQQGKQFILQVCVDDDLLGGSESWRYDRVCLQVTRVAEKNSGSIGAAGLQTYDVLQRLPAISDQNISITPVADKMGYADALYYTVSWPQAENAKVANYTLTAVDEDGNVLQTWTTEGKTPSKEIDLEQYQGKTLRFVVTARKAADDNTCYDGPDSKESAAITVEARAAAPDVSSANFEQPTPSQTEFLEQLKLDIALANEPAGNIYFTGYLFANKNDYETVKSLAATWQNAPAGDEKAAAQAELTSTLEAMLADGRAERVIPDGSAQVGKGPLPGGQNTSYTFGVDLDGFTMKPQHAKQYLLPAVRLMPTTDQTASNWHYILQDADAAQLPAIKLDTPVDADEPQRALSNVAVAHTVTLYDNAACTGTDLGETSLDLQRFTVEWAAANVYTDENGTVSNLTDLYKFTVTPMEKQDEPYTIEMQVYTRDETDADGNVVHHRGEIRAVEKTLNDETYALPALTEDSGRTYYDLSMVPKKNDDGEIIRDADGNVAELVSEPKTIIGAVRQDGNLRYYKTEAVPELEVLLADDAEPTYRITLPELQSKVTDDELDLQKFTQSITLQTLACTETGDKTTESETVTVTVNEQTAEQSLPEESAPVIVAEAAAPAVQSAAPAADTPVMLPAVPERPIVIQTPETAQPAA